MSENHISAHYSLLWQEKEVINSIKKEFPNEKVIYVKKQKNAYKIKFKNRTNITVDFEGNIKKGRRDY